MNRTIFIFIILLVVKAGAQTPALAVADSLHAVGQTGKAVEALESTDPKSQAVFLKLAKYQSATGIQQPLWKITGSCYKKIPNGSSPLLSLLKPW